MALQHTRSLLVHAGAFAHRPNGVQAIVGFWSNNFNPDPTFSRTVGMEHFEPKEKMSRFAFTCICLCCRRYWPCAHLNTTVGQELVGVTMLIFAYMTKKAKTVIFNITYTCVFRRCETTSKLAVAEEIKAALLALNKTADTDNAKKSRSAVNLHYLSWAYKRGSKRPVSSL